MNFELLIIILAWIGLIIGLGINILLHITWNRMNAWERATNELFFIRFYMLTLISGIILLIYYLG